MSSLREISGVHGSYVRSTERVKEIHQTRQDFIAAGLQVAATGAGTSFAAAGIELSTTLRTVSVCSVASSLISRSC